ncbi:phage major capsid protein [Paenibacillus donghaensis]|uniref:Phage major capsid protein n=2 Tax=Paenibacillus donghaensis TaxID=414771 RepID=A0A2Z2KDW5_9BACL|nr:phage major capsid protein [Paenibacillus donghaensis]
MRMNTTLFDLKNNVISIGNELLAVKQEKIAEASKHDANPETIKQLELNETSLQARFDVFKNEYEAMNAEEMASMSPNNRRFNGEYNDPKLHIESAKAAFIRAVARGASVTTGVSAALGDDNSSGGERILPKTMTNELLHEPFIKNPLREVSTFTSITNLEIPKVIFTLDNDDFIEDTETAKELETEGDVVKFGRNKFKVFAPVSESILAASDTNLVQIVDQALRSGLAAKEKKVAFASSPKAGEEHMSFYSTQNAIIVVNGISLYKAIKAAIAALPEYFRENASVVMRYEDYLDIIEILSNGSATLFDAQPEQILGKPVEFCDLAIKPIIGDFSYSHFNYDPQIIYDRDKDVKTGMWDFVLTAWFDHQIKLKSAFRIANVQ